MYLKRQNQSNPISRKYTYTLLGLLSFIIVICGIAFVSDENHSGLDHPAGLMINNFLIPLAAIVLLFGLINERTLLQRFLSTPLLQKLGKSSYAFYLIHAGHFYEIIYYQISNNIVVIFIVMNLIAVTLYYVIEKPLNKKWRAKDI